VGKIDQNARAQAEIEAGRLWRAKEILRGHLETRGYDLALYETYGRLLLLMHDDFEAGRYLYLSGVRHPEFEEAIGFYLKRYGADWQKLRGSFRKHARLGKREDYPSAVSNHLKQLGAPSEFGDSVSVAPPATGRQVFIDSLGCGLATSVAVFLLAAVAVGFWRGIPHQIGLVHLVLFLVVALVAAIWYAVKNRSG